MGTSQYIVLHVGSERYGARVSQVQGIDKTPHITSVPNTLSFLRGVSHIRSVPTPVIDLRVPAAFTDALSGFIEGVAKIADTLLVLLDLEHVLADIELLELRSVAAAVEQ